MHIVIYARYSSDLQRDASIEDQIRVCRTRADREGWNVLDVYALASAMATARPTPPPFARAIRR